MYLILTDAAIQHSAVEPKTKARISSEEQGTCNFPSLLFVSLMTKLSKHPIKYRCNRPKYTPGRIIPGVKAA